MSKLSAIGVVATLLSLASSVYATNLYTPPFWAGAPGDSAICKVYNVSTTAKTVQVQLINATSGTVLADSGSVVLNPATLLEEIDNTGNHDVTCHFVAARSAVRASGTFAPGPVFNDVLVVPAQ